MPKTTNYELNLPLPSDYYHVEVQNENMEKIDHALATLIGVGTYIGDGAEARTIPLPRSPKFVLLLQNGSLISLRDEGYFQFGGLAVSGAPSERDGACITLEEGGFSVHHAPNASGTKHCLNTIGERYSYIWG